VGGSARRPRILFATYGTETSGLGHVVRDIALARYLTHEYDAVFALPSLCEAARVAESAGCGVCVSGLDEAISNGEPQVIVYDRPPALGRMPLGDGGATPPILALDYFEYDDERVTAFVNIKSHGIGPIRPAGMYEGIEYAIVRPEIVEHRGEASPPCTPVRRALVTFGGADPSAHVHEALSLLGSDPAGLAVDVVLGRSYAGDDPPQGCFVSFTVRRDVCATDMGALMARADLVFCGAGVTLAEAMTLSRPACVMPQNAEELSLAMDVAEKGACFLLDPGKRHVWTDIVATARIDEARRLAVAGRAGSLCDGRGLERVAQLIRRYAKGYQ